MFVNDDDEDDDGQDEDSDSVLYLPMMVTAKVQESKPIKSFMRISRNVMNS